MSTTPSIPAQEAARLLWDSCILGHPEEHHLAEVVQDAHFAECMRCPHREWIERLVTVVRNLREAATRGYAGVGLSSSDPTVMMADATLAELESERGIRPVRA